jgi:hypothetical protein
MKKEAILFFAFAQMLFDSEYQAEKGAQILEGILKARSPRLSGIAQQMPGSSTANCKTIQRFLSQVDPREALWRLFQVEAPFVIADPTEIPRPQARNTPLCGHLAGWQDQRVLALGFGHSLSWAGHPFRVRDLFFTDHGPRRKLP